ncbi:amino acid ABC transporter ATP-binding protein [Fusibacter sp. A1]|nr:amino acid ABC transporter ATP-binding protein [Fusibacter sp. A1]RXV58703.1 amino acid ABC transporter ATP-binding protein [Fusibacter sp. A1]
MLSLRNIHKSYGDLHVLKGIDLDIKSGEIIAVLGPSGSGKSTLLKTINFLETPQAGEYAFKGFRKKVAHITHNDHVDLRKLISMVFQNHNLFDHFTVRDNLSKPLRIVHHLSKKEATELAYKTLDTVGLSDKYDAYPSQLSGGQQQRVGIARAIAHQPDLVLFDEPTSALDPELVQEVLSVIQALSKTEMTMLIVTHEVQFALTVADRVLFMEDGLIIADQTSQQIRQEPHPRFEAYLKGLQTQSH